MNLIKQISALLAGLLLSGYALAMDLNQAMSALPAAKASGQLGEQADGYLGVVSNQGQASAIAQLINQARRAEYQRVAQSTGASLADVQALAGKKAIEKTPSGQYININGAWQRK